MAEWQAIISVAEKLATLSAGALLALLFALWLKGWIHSDKEVVFREQLRQESLVLRKEAVDDRRAADIKLVELTQALKDSNEINRQLIVFNQRLVDDFIRRPREGS